MGEIVDRQKVVIVGETGVGKTSILFRYRDDEFKPNIQTTIGVDFFQKKVIIKNTIVSINFWDIAGQRKFQSIAKNNFKGSAGVIFVFDLSNKSSFRDLDEWIQNVTNEIGAPNSGSYISILVGNKCDMKRQVGQEEIIKKAKEMGVQYIECSAKNDINVQSTINTLAQMLIDRYRNSPQITSGIQKLKPNNKPQYNENQSGCCNKNQ